MRNSKRNRAGEEDRSQSLEEIKEQLKVRTSRHLAAIRKYEVAHSIWPFCIAQEVLQNKVGTLDSFKAFCWHMCFSFALENFTAVQSHSLDPTLLSQVSKLLS